MGPATTVTSSHYLQDGATYIRKVRRSAISCCINIPDLRKDILYNLLAIIGQWYNKDVNDGLILSNRSKRSESVRTNEVISLELLSLTSVFF